MVIPCLCLFVALSSLFSELVGAKPLHLLTQTVLLLVQTQTSDKQKSTRTLFHKESGSGTNCMVVNRHMVIRTLMQSSSAIRKEPFPQSLSS